MTALLASVRNLREAGLAARLGADIIDLKDPANGALGALDTRSIEEIVKHYNGLCPLSATLGDLPFRVAAIAPRLEAMHDTGVDIIKIGVFDRALVPETCQLLAGLARKGQRIVLVFFAEDYHETAVDFRWLANLGFYGLMLDTREKTSGNLCHKLAHTMLERFSRRCREHQLYCGLAGSVGDADIPGLLVAGPDYIGFRGALCNGGQRGGTIDEKAFCTIRALIPRKNGKQEASASIL